ncbi:2TM domain-containing protein [uncultured Dokdonia sp.]|uniref:2TM domain-containing protein n=1 Tax=uncultured Dokdonia sp. TaxID=575653 RepID=UPI00261DC1E8|nr:2TM domain-containing protein [uncultured Dokdonia sp.]
MNHSDEEKYERVKKQIKNERSWYSHLLAYIVFCTVGQLFYAGVFDGGSFTSYIPFWTRLITPVLWGIALLLHWFYVFKGVRYNAFYKKWEQRKIQEYMESEEEDYINNNRK